MILFTKVSYNVIATHYTAQFTVKAKEEKIYTDFCASINNVKSLSEIGDFITNKSETGKF